MQQLSERIALSSTPDPRIFISYARTDGLSLARQIRKQLEDEGLALVVTPSVFQRHVVKREVRLARQEGVQVSPVMGTADLDIDTLPRWIGHAHNIQFPEQWERLLAVLWGPKMTKLEGRKPPARQPDYSNGSFYVP